MAAPAASPSSRRCSAGIPSATSSGCPNPAAGNHSSGSSGSTPDKTTALWSLLGVRLEQGDLLGEHLVDGFSKLVEATGHVAADGVGHGHGGTLAARCDLPGHAAGDAELLERPESGGEAEQAVGDDVDDAAVFDAEAVRQLLAEASARLRHDRHVRRVARVGVRLAPPRPDVDQRAEDAVRSG